MEFREYGVEIIIGSEATGFDRVEGFWFRDWVRGLGIRDWQGNPKPYPSY